MCGDFDFYNTASQGRAHEFPCRARNAAVYDCYTLWQLLLKLSQNLLDRANGIAVCPNITFRQCLVVGVDYNAFCGDAAYVYP
jgi:hypothetical protein